MKGSIFFALLIILAIGITVFGQAKDADAVNPVIEVTGKAEIAVEPDSATISVDFTKLDKDLQTARKANEDGEIGRAHV